jgi:hypothetical protein
MNRVLFVVGACCALNTALASGEEEKKIAYLDLGGKITPKLDDNFGADGRPGNFLTVPMGEQSFAEIKFKIGEGVIQLGSKVLQDKPEKVEGIQVDKKASKLHILHATGYGGGPNVPGAPWHVADDALIGEYKINYEDKSAEHIQIVFGQDVRDWWFRADEKETSRGKVAWKGDNELAKNYECRLRLYLTTWDNPTPDRKIVSIDYIGKKDETVAAPFCVAISLEEK